MCPVEGALLDGHLCLTVELLSFRSVAERHHFGSHPNGQQLIKVRRRGVCLMNLYVWLIL